MTNKIQVGKHYQIQHPEDSCYANDNGQIVLVKGLINHGNLYRRCSSYLWQNLRSSAFRAGCDLEGDLTKNYQHQRKQGVKFTFGGLDGDVFSCDIIIDRSYLVPLSNSSAASATSPCSCTSATLFNQGCQCGHLKAQDEND